MMPVCNIVAVQRNSIILSAYVNSISWISTLFQIKNIEYHRDVGIHSDVQDSNFIFFFLMNKKFISDFLLNFYL